MIILHTDNLDLARQSVPGRGPGPPFGSLLAFLRCRATSSESILLNNIFRMVLIRLPFNLGHRFSHSGFNHSSELAEGRGTGLDTVRVLNSITHMGMAACPLGRGFCPPLNLPCFRDIKLRLSVDVGTKRPAGLVGSTHGSTIQVNLNT